MPKHLISRARIFVVRNIALTVYFPVCLVMTYPLVVHILNSVPGASGDTDVFFWNFWWFRKQILTNPRQLFFTKVIFYPIGTNLILHTHCLLDVLLSIPFSMFGNKILTFNLTILAVALTSGIAMHFLARKLGFEEKIALFAGLGYMICPFRMSALTGEINLFNTQWFPIYMILLLSLREMRPAKAGVIWGLVALGVFLTDYYYTLFLLWLTILHFLFVFYHERRLYPWKTLFKQTAAASAVLAIPAIFFLYSLYIQQRSEGGYLLQGFSGAERQGMDLLAPILPPANHPIIGRLLRPYLASLGYIDYLRWSFYLGLSMLGMASITLLKAERRRSTSFWWVAAGLFFVLSLGPFLAIGGRSEFRIENVYFKIPLPLLWLHVLPTFRYLRNPYYAFIVVVFSLTVVAAHGLQYLMRKCSYKLGEWFLWGSVTLLLLFEYSSFPIPMRNFPLGKRLRRSARAQPRGSILTIPIGWQDGLRMYGIPASRPMAEQAYHGMPLLGGYISRVPDRVFRYFNAIPILRQIVFKEESRNIPEESIPREEVESFVRFFQLEKVVVAPEFYDTPAERYVVRLFDLRCAYAGPDGRIYDVRASSPLSDYVHLESGDPNDSYHFIRYWTEIFPGADLAYRWCYNGKGRILFRWPKDRPCYCRARLLAHPLSRKQKIRISLNGKPVSVLDTKPGWRVYDFILDSRLLTDGLNELTMETDVRVAPAEYVPPDYRIGESGFMSPNEIEVFARVESTYITRSYIKIGKKRLATFVRVLQLVLLDSTSGKVIVNKHLDLLSDPLDEWLYTRLLKKAPRGTICVVLGTSLMRYNHLGRLIDSLVEWGAPVSPTLESCDLLAFVGAKGARPGTCLLQLSRKKVHIAIGHLAERRRFSFALSDLEIQDHAFADTGRNTSR